MESFKTHKCLLYLGAPLLDYFHSGDIIHRKANWDKIQAQSVRVAIRIYDSLPILTFSLWVSNSDQDDLFTRAMWGKPE